MAFSIIGCWQVTRGVRRLNLAIAAWLLAAPWVLDYPLIAAASSVPSGLLLAGLAMTGFEASDGIDGGWRSLWREES